MIKIIIKYITYLLTYLYLHIVFIIFIYKFCFSLKIKYTSNINLSYNTLLPYKEDFDLQEELYYHSFDTKKITAHTKSPLLQINNLLLFNYNIGINEKLYQIHKKNTQCTIPIIESKIPIYQINEFLVKLIYNQYINFHMLSNEYPQITILSTKLISIKTHHNNLKLHPWHIVSKKEYEKIIKEKITDLRLYY